MFCTIGPESMDISSPLEEVNTDDLYTDLTVDSLVEVKLEKSNIYGIIRWIGRLPGRKELMAGLELVTFTLTLLCRLKSN